MAKAELISERVVTVTRAVKLNLSIQEAEFLAAVLGHIAGSERESPRKHAAAVSKALREAGVSAFAGELVDPFKFIQTDVRPLRHVESLFDRRHVGTGMRFNAYPADWTAEERG